MIFKHRTPIQIRFKDIDKMGHVNNANHFTYLELARMKYFNDVIAVKIDWTKQGFILARVEINYKQPIFLEDKIEVPTKCTKFGTKSFDLSHSIMKTENGAEANLAAGMSVVVCYDYEKGMSMSVPDDWKKKIEMYEN